MRIPTDEHNLVDPSKWDELYSQMPKKCQRLVYDMNLHPDCMGIGWNEVLGWFIAGGGQGFAIYWAEKGVEVLAEYERKTERGENMDSHRTDSGGGECNVDGCGDCHCDEPLEKESKSLANNKEKPHVFLECIERIRNLDKEGFQKLREDAKAIFGDEPFTVDTGHYLDHLLAELVELRKDKARMDLLEKNDVYYEDELIIGGIELGSVKKEGTSWRLQTIREACDENMQKSLK